MPRLQIAYLDGQRAWQAFRAGALWVIQHREALDRINVFPVADRDTGTNLALSFHRVLRALGAPGSRDLRRVLQRISEALVTEARGNSGVIFSQFFAGLTEAVGYRRKIRARSLVQAMEHAVRRTYENLEDPREGTVLTVMREAVAGARQAVGGSLDLVDLLEALLQAARRALQRTPDLLDSLKRAGVVDAGGQGFVYFLEGIQQLVHRGNAALPDGAGPPGENEINLVHAPGTPSFRFCTEAVLQTPGPAQPLARELRGLLRPLGDSLVLSAAHRLVHLHIHTNDPEEVYRRLRQYGTLLRQKAQDMQAQVAGEERAPLGLVLDSTGDVPLLLQQELGIQVAPQQILVEGQAFLDRVEVTPDQVLAWLQEGRRLTSSQVSPADMEQAIRRALERAEQVLVLTVSSRLSGTYQTAVGIARRFPGRVWVWDTWSISLGMTLQGLTALDLARQGRSPEEILQILERTRREARLFFTLPTLKYLMRSGRISRLQGRLGMLLGLRLVMALEEGRIVKKTSALSEKGIRSRVQQLLDRTLDPQQVYDMALAWNTDPRIREILEPYLRKRFRIRRFLATEITPVISLHTGPGAWGVFALPVPGELEETPAGFTPVYRR